MRRPIVAAGSTLTVGELRELTDGLDPGVPVYLPGFTRRRAIDGATATDLEVVLAPSPYVLDDEEQRLEAISVAETLPRQP